MIGLDIMTAPWAITPEWAYKQKIKNLIKEIRDDAGGVSMQEQKKNEEKKIMRELTLEEKAIQDWKQSPDLRGEFKRLSVYFAYLKAEKAGKVTIIGKGAMNAGLVEALKEQLIQGYEKEHEVSYRDAVLAVSREHPEFFK